jgi:pimeloyl-ACP methyl ester carboxylesterase
MFWSVLTIVVAVYIGLCGVMFFMQRSLIYMPTPATQAHNAAMILKVPGAQLRISSRPHDGPKAVLYFGGNAEDVVYAVADLSAAFPDRAIYGLHYRGYSGSSGKPSEGALRSDAKAVFEMVHDRHADVLVIGRSLGTSLAIQLAAEEPVSRLVLITPFESILKIASRVVPFLPVRWLLADPHESWRYADKVTCPTTIIAASEDEVVPTIDTQQLFKTFKPGVATMVMINGANHNSVSSTGEFWDALSDDGSEHDR